MINNTNLFITINNKQPCFHYKWMDVIMVINNMLSYHHNDWVDEPIETGEIVK